MRKSLNASVTRLLLIVCCLSVVSVPTWAAHPKPDGDITNLSFYQGSGQVDPYPASGSRSVRNVIMMIGDGMGVNQVLLARLKAVGAEGKLYMERMPVSGMIRTHSADNLVTDSAAAGTALSSGIKTDNGMIGMTPEGRRYRTILEAAKAKGLATGLVATSAITHATPASYASHVRSRGDETRIAEQMIAGDVDLMFGGGRKYFLPRSERGARRDGHNLWADANEAGYTTVETGEQLQNVTHLPVLGLFQLDAMTTEPPEPSLATLTGKAVGLLKDNRKGWFIRKRGFFLMVEGSQIDWACHDNDAADCVWQTLQFDLAVKEAIDFALADGRTLVIVTADHETGGLTIPGGNMDGDKLKVKWSTGGHTGSPVPVYALGPGAEDFGGIYDNTELSGKIAKLLRIAPWPQTVEEEKDQARSEATLDVDVMGLVDDVDNAQAEAVYHGHAVREVHLASAG
jgi:alkaline phosphatase